MREEFKKSKRTMRDLKLVIAAGDEREIAAAGKFIMVKAAAGDVIVTTDGQPARMQDGDFLEYESAFDGFRIQNPGTVAIEVVLTVGFGVFRRNPSAVAPDIDTDADVTLAQNNSTLYTNPSKRRKAVIIHALVANTAAIRVVGGAAAAGGIEVSPGETLQLDTSGVITVWNPDAANQTYSFTQLFDPVP